MASIPILHSHNGWGVQLYGHKDPRYLTGAEAVQAVQAGFHPVSYQAVLWFTEFFVPIVPLGVYRVVDAQDATFGQRRKMTPVPWDWRQIAWHYLGGVCGLACIPLAIVAIGLLGWGLASIAPPMTQ